MLKSGTMNSKRERRESAMPQLRLFMADTLTPYKIVQLKMHEEYDNKLKVLESDYLISRKAKVQEHQKAFQALLERQRADLSKIKAEIPLPKRVVVMAENVRNLRLQRANRAADEIERLRAKLEEKFWRDTLGAKGGPLYTMDAEQRLLRDKQTLEMSEMAVEMERKRKEWAAQRTSAIQRSKQGVPRKGEHPFSVWYYARRGELAQLLTVLARHPEQLDQQDPDTGHAALHCAAKNGQTACVRMLLERGANVNLRDGQGNTVLHLAAGWGNVETVAMLLEAAADPRCPNIDKKTPEDLAREKGMTKIAAFLGRWAPMGVSLEEREKIAVPEADPFTHEPHPVIRQQLRVLEMRQSRLGPDDPSLLPTLRKLTYLYRKQPGREASTRKVLERYLSVAEKAMGPYSLEVAWACNEMGEILHGQRTAEGKGAQSEEEDVGDEKVAQLFERAVHAVERVQGSKSPDLDTPLRNLALHYLSQSMVFEAEPVLQRLADMQMERQTTEMGSVPENVIPTLDLLAYTTLLKRDFASARSLYEKSLTIARQYYAPNDPGLAPRLENLAMVSFCEEDHRGAEQQFMKAHDLLVRAGADPFGPHVLRLAANVGVVVCRASTRKF